MWYSNFLICNIRRKKSFIVFRNKDKKIFEKKGIKIKKYGIITKGHLSDHLMSGQTEFACFVSDHNLVQCNFRKEKTMLFLLMIRFHN